MGVTTWPKDGAVVQNTAAIIIAMRFILFAILTAYMSRIRDLEVTPAMAAGVSDRMWPPEELVEQTSK